MMLRNGVMPIPPVKKTASRVSLGWSVKFPKGPSILTGVPSGMVLNSRLNAVSRIRVATINSHKSGTLAIEKVRVFPSASVSGGSRRVKFRQNRRPLWEFHAPSQRDATRRLLDRRDWHYAISEHHCGCCQKEAASPAFPLLFQPPPGRCCIPGRNPADGEFKFQLYINRHHYRTRKVKAL